MNNVFCICASCPYLKSRTEQTGVCTLLDDELMELTETCLLNRNMPTETTLRILHDLQKWRRGGSSPMVPPYVIGCAIDSAIKKLRKQKRDESNR